MALINPYEISDAVNALQSAVEAAKQAASALASAEQNIQAAQSAFNAAQSQLSSDDPDGKSARQGAISASRAQLQQAQQAYQQAKSAHSGAMQELMRIRQDTENLLGRVQNAHAQSRQAANRFQSKMNKVQGQALGGGMQAGKQGLEQDVSLLEQYASQLRSALGAASQAGQASVGGLENQVDGQGGTPPGTSYDSPTAYDIGGAGYGNPSYDSSTSYSPPSTTSSSRAYDFNTYTASELAHRLPTGYYPSIDDQLQATPYDGYDASSPDYAAIKAKYCERLDNELSQLTKGGW